MFPPIRKTVNANPLARMWDNVISSTFLCDPNVSTFSRIGWQLLIT